MHFVNLGASQITKFYLIAISFAFGMDETVKLTLSTRLTSQEDKVQEVIKSDQITMSTILPTQVLHRKGL